MSLDESLVLEAARALEGKIVKTPLLSVPELDELASSGGPRREVLLKVESLQYVGAFKARGALFAASRLSPDALAAGLCTYSSGNHGQAVALAAKRHATTAVIVMPLDAPAPKVDAVRRLGAEIVFEGTTTTERKRRAEAISRERGLTIVPPFDDDHVIAGQGTATLELCREAEASGRPVDAVVVPVGGGGLLAGACLAVRTVRPTATRPAPIVVAAEPDTANAMQQSLAAGERVTVAPSTSIADGLRPVQVGERNFAIAREHVRHAVTVDDRAIGLAVARLAALAKLVVEPSGACALAAVFAKSFPPEVRRIGVIVSGGNVSTELFGRLLREYEGAVFPA
jgi:threonine dehydratase